MQNAAVVAALHTELVAVVEVVLAGAVTLGLVGGTRVAAAVEVPVAAEHVAEEKLAVVEHVAEEVVAVVEHVAEEVVAVVEHVAEEVVAVVEHAAVAEEIVEAECDMRLEQVAVVAHSLPAGTVAAVLAEVVERVQPHTEQVPANRADSCQEQQLEEDDDPAHSGLKPLT